MWELGWWWSCRGTNKCTDKIPPQYHQHQQALLLPQNDADDDPTATIASAAMFLISWLRMRGRPCILLLLLCSPLLLPFLCATFPLLCAVEVFLRCRYYRRCWRRRPQKSTPPADYRRACESEGDEVSLLQRYLEDQFQLVVESVCDCSGNSDL